MSLKSVTLILSAFTNWCHVLVCLCWMFVHLLLSKNVYVHSDLHSSVVHVYTDYSKTSTGMGFDVLFPDCSFQYIQYCWTFDLSPFFIACLFLFYNPILWFFRSLNDCFALSNFFVPLVMLMVVVMKTFKVFCILWLQSFLSLPLIPFPTSD